MASASGPPGSATSGRPSALRRRQGKTTEVIMFSARRNLKAMGTRAKIASVVSALVLNSAAAQATIFTVTSGNDSGAGTLRQAILDVSSSGGDTINFTTGLATIKPHER